VTRRRTTNLRWATLPFARLLDLRLCDLGVRIEGTWFEECIERLYEELEERDIVLRPHCWLSDEWFSPQEAPGIAIPFYLTHQRLMALERREMFEVEGGTRRDCMKLLRHEAAHAIQIAYRVHRRRKWQQTFGSSSLPYPDYYRPNPSSRRFVLHLDSWYAQSHPDEDFAETFAVWLDPRSGWRRRYARWPALKKLEYVDELMQTIAGVRPSVRSRATTNRLSRLRHTLGEHYEAKRKRYSVTYPAAFDDDLRRLFKAPEKTRAGETAMSFLRRNRKEIRELVSRWTGEYQFTVDQVLKEMMVRCRQMRLRAVGSKQRLKVECAVLLTVHTMHTLKRREWHPL
jgi:hypothetical protein